MKLKSLIVVACFVSSTSALCYEFSTGKVFLRGAVGPAINVFRYDDLTSEASPSAGLMLAIEGEYIVAQPWALIGGFRPTFSTGSIDLKFGFGARYRWDNLGMPIILSTGLELTPALLVPTNGASTHFNLGIRPSFAAEYFVMRDLVLSAQLALDPSMLVTERFRSFEASIEFLFGVAVKI